MELGTCISAGKRVQTQIESEFELLEKATDGVACTSAGLVDRINSVLAPEPFACENVRCDDRMVGSLVAERIRTIRIRLERIQFNLDGAWHRVEL